MTEGIGFFEIVYIGIPCAIISFIYIMLASGKLLPDRGLGLSLFKDPRQLLRENDRIVFVGILDSVVDLQHVKGLKLATYQIFKLDVLPSDRMLVEAVILPLKILIRRSR
jgi:hypothetical protein